MSKKTTQDNTSGFLRNTATLLSGNVVSQAVAFAVYPLLTRMYSASDFGVLAIFTSIFSLFRIASTGRYDFAIVMSESEEEAKSLFKLSTKINLLFSLVLLLIVVVGKILFPSFSYFDELGGFVYTIPLMVFLAGFCLSACYYLNKKKQYATMAKADIVTSSSISMFKLGFGFAKYTQIGLITASVIGQFIGAVYYFIKVGAKSFREKSLSLSIVAKKHKNFPLYVMPKEFIHTLSTRLPFLILVFYFGTELLGFYSMAITLSMIPIGLFAGSLTKVLYQRMAENTLEKKPVTPLFKDIALKLSIIALPVFIVLFLFAEPVFSFVLSEEWCQSAVYFQIILPCAYIYLISSPFDFVPNLFYEQKKAVIFDIAYLSLCLVGLMIGIWVNDFRLSIILFSVAGVLNFSFLFVWYFCLLKRYEKSLL